MKYCLRGVVVIDWFFNPDAEELVAKAEEKHRHSGERNGYSLTRGEAGHRVGMQRPRQRGREGREGLGWTRTAEPGHWIRRHAPGNGTERLRREMKNTKKNKQEKEGSDQASAGKICSTKGPSETEGDTCGGSDLYAPWL